MAITLAFEKARCYAVRRCYMATAFARLTA